MSIKLYDYQRDALSRMKNGCILCGGVGSGKSRTSLAYYYICNGGDLDGNGKKSYMKNPKDLYVITTARKRDTNEWESEFIPFLIGDELYSNKVIVDSWNNIKKYSDVKDAFFIFDEQRVVGWGAWSKAFVKIAHQNHWILLSATPGDTWMDYCAVFVANGFFRNKSEFVRNHVVYKQYAKFPQIDRIINTGRLMRLRSSILVQMNFNRDTISHHIDVYTEYSLLNYKRTQRDRWNVFESRPLENASELCQALRKVVNSDESRIEAVHEIIKEHPRVIIFYNYDYELELLKNERYGDDVEIAEWNGHKHQDIPNCRSWVYLVQYNAGAEGWNCITTDTIIFYSQNYSYKIMVQSSGRIDRLNTPFTDLYYYHLKTHAGIDLAISRALKEKKKFNEAKFAKW